MAMESDYAMNRSARVLVVLAALFVLLAGTGCNKLKARDQLNKGVQAYKNARYGKVVEVVDDIRSAGVDDVGLLTDQKKATNTKPGTPPSAGGQQ